MQYEIRAYDALYDTRQDFNKNGALTGEQCVGRCDVTITIAGVMLHAAGAKEERYEPVD